MNNIEQIIKLNELGFSTEQISQIIGLNETPSQANTKRLEEEEQVSTPAPEAKEVETPQIDYKKLAQEVALLNQRNSAVESKIDTNNNQPEKPEVKLPSAEDVILGFLD